MRLTCQKVNGRERRETLLSLGLEVINGMTKEKSPVIFKCWRRRGYVSDLQRTGMLSPGASDPS